MNLAWLSIGQPWALWGLLLCPLLAVLLWRNRLDVTRTQAFVAMVARVLCAAFLVLAVADARVRWPTRRLAVAFVDDRSASVSSSEVARLRSALPRRRIERDDVRWIELGALQRERAKETDLATAIDLAVATLPTDRVRRVFLATDGRATLGDTFAAAERARRAGARVYALALGDHPAVDGVAATGIEVPRLVRAGREVGLGVRVFATREGPVVLHVSRDGTEVLTRTLDASVGTSLHDVRITMPDEGVHEVAARVERENDPVAENNIWSTLVRVVSPPRVLLVHELTTGEPALATVFRDARLGVDVVRADGVPGDVPGLDRYQLVVLDELVLTSLSETQQRALRAWVEQRGGGLITTTGMHGVGREPELLREIEPIEPPRAIPEPRPIELILVIDRSGSMMGPNIVNARNAGIAAVRALRPDSRVGLVAFSGSADLVVPPVPVARAEEVTRAIAGIRASGGTDLAAALTAATSIVSNDDRYLRHVILMSDGESRAPPAIAAAQALRATGASITAITLGPRVQLMSDIARIGRGRYHVTARSTSLPSLFVREAQFRSAPPAREVTFRPTVRARMAFMNDYDPAGDPPLLGYTQSAARRGALTLLGAPESAPLLAHWFVGPGQVASFTSSTSSRWANAWRTGAGFRRLFSQMAWEMLRPQSDDNLELHVAEVEGRRGVRRITVVAPGVSSEVVPIVTLSRGRDAGVRLDLRPAAPGVWTSHVALERGFVVDARLPASREPGVAVSDEAPYPAELRAWGADMATLGAVTRLGGGRVVTSVDAVLNDVSSERVMRDARLPLLLGALLAYIVGVAALRVSFRRGMRLMRSAP